MPQPAKECIFCGIDVSNQPRVRDARGRYACKVCLKNSANDRATPRSAEEPKRSRARTRQGGDAPVAVAPIVDDDLDIASVVGELPAAEPIALREMQACPVCEKIVHDEQVICLNCGANIASGKKSKTRVHDRVQGEAPPPPTPVRLAVAAALAAGGAGAGLGIWIAASTATGETLSYLAGLVGLLAGVLPLFAVRGDGRLATGAIAAGLASLACMGALAASPDDVPSDDFRDERTGEYVWDIEFEDHTGQVFSEQLLVTGTDESQRLVFQAAWVLFGAVTAFGLGASTPFDRDEDDDE